jgi:hypothetical protein
MFFQFKIGQGYGGFRMAPAGSWEDTCTPSGFYYKMQVMNEPPRFEPHLDKIIHFFVVGGVDISAEINIRFNKEHFHGFAVRFKAQFTLFNLPVFSIEVQFQFMTAHEIQRRINFGLEESGCQCNAGYEDGYCRDPITPADRYIFNRAQGRNVVMASFAFSVCTGMVGGGVVPACPWVIAGVL